MKIIVTGGTGFVGSSLVPALIADGHHVVVLSRNPDSARGQLPSAVPLVEWDAKTLGAWADEVDGADAVLNYVGESIGGKRWSSAQKERLIASRIGATKALVTAIERAKKRPSVLVSASAVGYYGNVESGDVPESHPPGNDFLAQLCVQWEAATRAAEPLGVRVVTTRTGVILGKGGALTKMLLPFKLFFGGQLGSGKQWFPWVHMEDVVGAIIFAMTNSKITGPVNVAGPEAVTMREFCTALGRAMRRPSWAPVPSFVLQIALGEMSSMILTGQKVVPAKLLRLGYSFKYPRVAEALAATVRS